MGQDAFPELSRIWFQYFAILGCVSQTVSTTQLQVDHQCMEIALGTTRQCLYSIQAALDVAKYLFGPVLVRSRWDNAGTNQSKYRLEVDRQTNCTQSHREPDMWWRAVTGVFQILSTPSISCCGLNLQIEADPSQVMSVTLHVESSFRDDYTLLP